ncbi:hypothetical protein NKH48_32705 [Mesorhizobium sp. M1233]|uniref:hypothetical protein n=1 Tax=Mesorhizobium sp. M1233 TaxID=2957072 RepID=UPI00333A23EC
MAKDIYAQEQIRLQKAIRNVVKAIAELGELRDAPTWENDMAILKKAILDLEDRMSDDRGMVNQLMKSSNR